MPEALAVPALAVGWNAAKTYLAVLIVTVQTLPDTVVHPDHPPKTELASAVAVRVTTVAGVVFGSWMLQPATDPVVQLIPPPLIVPFPVPVDTAVRV